MARVIAIVNQKGGVGKTTTAVNLSACLAAGEKRTLLVDIDPQANATSGLGIDRNAVPGTYQILMEGIPAESAILPTMVPALEAIPAGEGLVGAEVELVDASDRERRLRKGLEPLLGKYDYILIDCPPSLGLLTINALAAATAVLIPLQCEYYALEGLAQILEAIRLCQKKINPTLTVEGILLTMYDSRINLSDQVAQDVKEHFPGRVFNTVVPRNVRLSEAPSFGMPVILYDIRSAGAESYLRLAKEVIHGAA